MSVWRLKDFPMEPQDYHVKSLWLTHGEGKHQMLHAGPAAYVTVRHK